MNDREPQEDSDPSSNGSDDWLLRRVAATDPPSPRLAVPQLVGRYEVGRTIGRGGLGVVHRGWDPQLRRAVALKFVRPERLSGVDERDPTGRLRHEARTLARLDHPALVQVFDVGECEGQLYIAMELLDGPTLRVWAQRQRSWRRIVAACLDAARGLAAAHRKGIVHRDFKPDNVVVADGSRVVVVDFGLASEADDASAVRTSNSGGWSRTVARQGLVAGTRGYMAPELLTGGSASAAADQYAWCTTCRDLLTGKRAGEAGTERSIPRWLDAILQRGLAEHPSDRFATMDELVEAVTVGLRGRRWGLGVAALGIVLAGAGWQAAEVLLAHRREDACDTQGREIEEVWNEEARAGIRAGLLATEVRYAAAAIERVVPRLEERAEQWRATRTDVCLRAGEGGRWDAALFERAIWCLEERRIDLEVTITALSSADVDVVPRIIAMASAAELLPPALCGNPRVVATFPEPPEEADRVELRALATELGHAHTLELRGRTREATDIATAVVEHSEAAKWLPLVLAARLRLGSVLTHAGRREQGRRELEVAYFGAEQLGWWSLSALAATRMVQTFRADQLDRALQWSRRAEVALANSPELARWLEPDRLAVTARAYQESGDLDLAISVYEEALAATEHNHGSDHPDTIAAVANLAAALYMRGERNQAGPLLRRAMELSVKVLGAEHPQTAGALNNLAVSLVEAGDYAGAVPLYQRALKIYERAHGPRHPDVGRSLNNLANAHTGLGQHEQARDLVVRALAEQERRLGADDPIVASMAYNLGNIHLRLGDLEQARSFHQRALASRQQVLGVDHADAADSLATLGTVHVALGSMDLAERHFREAIQALERSAGPDHPSIGYPAVSLARLELDRGRARAALPLAQRAVAIERRREDGEPARLAMAEAVLARALWDTGDDRQGAREIAERARITLAAAPGVWAPTLEEVERWLAEHP